MPGTACQRSALRRALLARLKGCAPPVVDLTIWIANQAGFEPDQVAGPLSGAEPLTVDLADALLRACCGESLRTLAGEVDRVTRSQAPKAES